MKEVKKDKSVNWMWLVIGALIAFGGAALDTKYHVGNFTFVICFFGGYIFGHQLVEIFKKK